MTILSFVLCIVYTAYLLVGGLMFTYLEYEVREEVIALAHPKWNRLKEIAVDRTAQDRESELAGLIGWLQTKCQTLPSNSSIHLTTIGNHSEVTAEIETRCPLLIDSVVGIKYEYPWTLIDAIYFSMTVITTIGFGHISPSTEEGKVACIIYSFIGIPLTLVLLARTSTFFGRRLYKLFTSKVDAAKQRSKVFIAIGAFFYVLLGLLVFICLPAVLFMYIEEWTYLDSVYFAYITLTTIGFGDFVTGKNMDEPWLSVYQIGVILWIMAGLGYWVMVANFMVLALKSEKVYAMARRVTELRHVVSQLSGGQHDPEFLTKSSKTSLNFLTQLASALAVPEMHAIPEDLTLEPSAINNSAANRPVIPGIAALFNQSGGGGLPLFQNVLQAGLKRDPDKEKGPNPNNEDPRQPQNEDLDGRCGFTLDCKLSPKSRYRAGCSPLSTSSECMSENDMSSYTLLSEMEDDTSTHQIIDVQNSLNKDNEGIESMNHKNLPIASNRSNCESPNNETFSLSTTKTHL